MFLQECRSTEVLSSVGPFVTQGVSATKAIALGSLDRTYQVAKLRRRANGGRAVVGATVSGPVAFTALGICAAT